MKHVDRFYRLLEAYEELTRLETFALSEDNLPYLNRIQLKKGKLAGQLAPMRRRAGLSPEESRQVDSRLRALETSEKQNLSLLQIAMKSVTESLAGLNANRTRCTRLGATYRTPALDSSGSLAGRA
jgi:hypothetical protein